MNDLFDKSRPPRPRHDSRTIAIRGAREHNLKNIDVEIPRDQLVVFTGLSGSGKSSLAFDTIYAEGQRRYVEIALGLCAPVPRDDAEARRRPDRRPVAGHLDRAEDHLAQPALDRRHRHRDLRLHAAAVGARRRALFAGHRAADREPDRLADGRPGDGAAGGHAALSAGADGARPQGRVPQGARRLHEARLPAREDRRQVLRDRRGAGARQEVQARHRRGGRPHRGAAAISRRGSPIRSRPRSSSPTASRWSSSPMAPPPWAAARPTSRRTRPPSGWSSRKNSPARCPASPFRRSSRGCSRSTIRSAPARPATGSASSSTSTPTWSFPTRTDAARGRHRAVGEVVDALLHADPAGARQALQLLARHPGRSCRRRRRRRSCTAPARTTSSSPMTTACAPTRPRSRSRAWSPTWSGAGARPRATGRARRSANTSPTSPARPAAATGSSPRRCA